MANKFPIRRQFLPAFSKALNAAGWKNICLDDINLEFFRWRVHASARILQTSDVSTELAGSARPLHEYWTRRIIVERHAAFAGVAGFAVRLNIFAVDGLARMRAQVVYPHRGGPQNKKRLRQMVVLNGVSNVTLRFNRSHPATTTSIFLAETTKLCGKGIWWRFHLAILTENLRQRRRNSIIRGKS